MCSRLLLQLYNVIVFLWVCWESSKRKFWASICDRLHIPRKAKLREAIYRLTIGIFTTIVKLSTCFHDNTSIVGLASISWGTLGDNN